jgi:hypothetical protein
LLPDFFVVDGIDTAGNLQGLVEPLAEAQVAHTAAFEEAGPELGSALQYPAATVPDSTAGGEE